jgi:flagellar protein FlaH
MYQDKEERKKTVISTGNFEIDTKMGGGIPIGSLTLIDGDSHSGKSVLSQQMIWGSLHDGFQLSLFTTENTVKSLITQMQSLNIDILDYLLLGKLKVFPMEVAQLRGQALKILIQAVRAEKDRDMVFVDSLTPCIVRNDVDNILGYFEECKRLCSNRKTIINIIHSHAVSKEVLVRIQSLCDAHLGLRTEEVGEKLIKTMEVSKVRGASKTTGNIVSFEIEPGWGMKIIPISKAQG